MRVLLVGTGVQPIPPTGYGGVERTIGELATALRAAGAEPVVVNRVRAGRTRDEYAFAWELPKLLAGETFDVVHASTPVVANRLELAGIPYVFTSHSRHWFEVGGITQRFGFYLERRAARCSTRLIALTDRLAARMRERLGDRLASRTTVMPIGVDTDRFRPRWSERTGTVALGVGVVRPFKRWELAARALRETGFRLRIAGPTPDSAYARRVVESGTDVRLLGEVTDEVLARELATADLLVHPSRVELLAGAVLQGLAAGLPVLGADPIAGLVRDGETGFLSAPGADDAAIVATLHARAREIADDPRALRRMGDAARADAAARFSWPVVARRHLEVYASAVAERPVTRRRTPAA